ncbi:MAG: helix-turn-helix domain-containing protein [Clostridia bacterium]
MRRSWKSIYQRIERCRLTGAVFDTWLRGQGLSAAAYILDLVQQYSSHQPVYLDHSDLMAIENAKALIKASLKNTPTIPGTLQKRWYEQEQAARRGFRLSQEGKSIAEYIRILRMERALDLLEDSTLSILEVAKEVGYHGVSNFYHTFPQTFLRETPQAVRELLKK